MDYDFRAEGRRLSNWGRWGPDDELGTLNFITADRVQRASASIRSGQVFELSIPISPDGPPWNGLIKRVSPIHLMSYLPKSGATKNAQFASDDFITMPLQYGTQWDSFAHVGYDDFFYNGVPVAEVTAAGAAKNSIDRTLPGMVGRGVLLDIAHYHGVEWLDGGVRIGPDELERVEQAQCVRAGPGDALLIRTGWRRKAIREGWHGWLATEPGLTVACAAWLHDREVAAVASDNHALEVTPTPDGTLPLHCILIRDMGMPIGEIFDLEQLAAACIAQGRWDFFFSAPPLRIPHAVGSPVSPIAVL